MSRSVRPSAAALASQAEGVARGVAEGVPPGMTREDLCALQRRDEPRVIDALIARCRERFLAAATLVRQENAETRAVRGLWRDGLPDQRWLVVLWRVLSQQYADECYDPQVPIDGDHAARVVQLWNDFVFQDVLRRIEADNSLVRDVLMLAGGLPCSDPADVVLAVWDALDPVLERISAALLERQNGGLE